MGDGWKALGDAVLNRRVEIGHKTREAFAQASGLSTKTLGEIERGERESYDRATLAQVERSLGWPAGRAREIVDGAAPRPEPVSVGVFVESASDLVFLRLLAESDLPPSRQVDLVAFVEDKRREQQAVLLLEAKRWISDPPPAKRAPGPFYLIYQSELPEPTKQSMAETFAQRLTELSASLLPEVKQWIERAEEINERTGQERIADILAGQRSDPDAKRDRRHADH